jgi:hypothetical protein
LDIVLDISLINKIDEYSVVSEIENLQKVYLEILNLLKHSSSSSPSRGELEPEA